MEGRSPIGKQVKLAVADSAVSLTLPTSGILPRAAEVTIGAASVRWLATGDTPKADEGMLAAANTTITLNTYRECANFKAIRTGSTSAQADITYYV